MKIIYNKQVDQRELPKDAIAETHIFCIEIKDINTHAKSLISEISDTSWILKLNPVAKMSYERRSIETISKLVEIFKLVENNVTKDFGEYMISMSSGKCLETERGHIVLPLSELWKEKITNNHGFDFHTIAPTNKFSFGEAKYASSGNSYTTSAEQTLRFAREGKDRGDGNDLENLGTTAAINNLLKGQRGFIVAFSINSPNHESILRNSLNNDDIKSLTRICDELYIIGVKI